MMDRPATPVATLVKAREIGLKAGLRHVYVGNIPGKPERTPIVMPVRNCSSSVWLYDSALPLEDGRCPKCQAEIDGVWK
jgi:pyruvate formate lyase activating enzyme